MDSQNQPATTTTAATADFDVSERLIDFIAQSTAPVLNHDRDVANATFAMQSTALDIIKNLEQKVDTAKAEARTKTELLARETLHAERVKAELNVCQVQKTELEREVFLLRRELGVLRRVVNA